MKSRYLVDLLLWEERSATVLVEARTEEEARELALIHTPEHQYDSLDCQSEVQLVTVSRGVVETSTEWGSYEIDRLVTIDGRGRVHYPLNGGPERSSSTP